MLWRIMYFLSRCIGLDFLTCLEILLQGMVAELPADFGSLETLSAKGELQAIDFALFVLHALYSNVVLIQFVEKHGVP